MGDEQNPSGLQGVEEREADLLAEIAALRHDLERHIQIAADLVSEPQTPRKTLEEFKEFLTDLAELNPDEATQIALLAAREYIAEDNNPKSNRVLGLIAVALDRDVQRCSDEMVTEPVKPCSHPHAKVWFYRDDDTFMICPDCNSRWCEQDTSTLSRPHRGHAGD